MTHDTYNVAGRAAKARIADEALALAIRDSHRAGMSLRKLAELTGMSHETVRRICSKDLNLPDELDGTDA